MPANEKRNRLHTVLAEKSVEELEEFLTMDFSENDDAEPDVEYIMEIMEVIRQKENQNEGREAKTDAAWRDFQAFLKEREENKSEADIAEEPSHDHHRKTEHGQRSRKYSRVLRYGVVAAAVAVLLCGTAFGWNIFQAIADWTTETFHFLTGQEPGEAPEPDVFEYLRIAVAEKTDVQAVPNWAPEGTVENGVMNVVERKDRSIVRMSFSVDGREFTVRIIIHDELPEEYTRIYQKDSTVEEEYAADGITHYIVGNNENLSVMWTNSCVEGYIQGALTLDEMKLMIDSIYEG